MEFKDYSVTVMLNVVATSANEARDALVRSGITAGELIGECLIMDVEVEPE